MSWLPGAFAVCRLDPSAPLSEPRAGASFFSVTRTVDELSVVCAEEEVPEGCRHEPGWRAMRIEGPISFSVTGVLSYLAGVLAEARVSIFTIATFDTDYVLVRSFDTKRAEEALSAAGFSFAGEA